ncbi:cobaltochelatase subunit CobN [Chloroflexus sp.]|uniref:cobaltochelatase subunit CobN n=1 Tax=Chloroflexus sp. TaxID=1904827 RepID=UPI0026096C79|nr:cobaltochelatase subunit CobN [uncultured Chloroflexus sp.]
MAESLKRNMVQRLDGRMVNAGARRGMLIVCATGCCCGHTERGFAPVPTDLYHTEWGRRRLRNRVHLSQGGCLGPCPLANVALLLMDGRPYWFHSLNDPALIPILYDFIEALLATDRPLAPPPPLIPHLFNGFAWDGSGALAEGTKAIPAVVGNGFLVLSQADTDLLALEQAVTLLPEGFAPVRMAHVGRVTEPAAIDRLLEVYLPDAAVVVARLHSPAAFAYGLERLQQWAAATGGFLLCLPAVEQVDPELMARSTVGVPLAMLASAYFRAGGAVNLANGLQCLSDHLLVSGWGYDPPVELPLHGLYVPPRPRRRRQAAQENPEVAAGAASTVGVLFYRAHLLGGNTAFIDALINGLQARGLQARAVYTHSLKETDAEGVPVALNLINQAGPVDVVISTLSFAIGDGDPHPFSRFNAPVVQALVSSTDRESWQRDGRGLGPLDTAMNVALPELDGRIIGVPVAFKEQAGDSAARSLPDPERIERLAGLVWRLAQLRRKPNSDKRIAVILTNSSAKAQRIGNAVGLDAPASLLRLLAALREAGYTIGEVPETGEQLIADLVARCSYDETWLTSEQLAQAYRVSVATYRRWFAGLPSALQEAMIRQWGPPPGSAYVHQDTLALAGLEFGNVFVALQPPRGYDMDPNAIYHRPDLPPPHNYYALYRWLRDEWQADAIIHLGKHGTLEWLPGKGVGLSAICFPDPFLGDLPLIYPFIINDPGEGTQAKRRAHAVIVDHLTPPMTSAGAYGDLAELAQLVDEYYRMERLDPGKLPLLQRQIWEVLQRSKLADDLRYILQADHGDHRHEWDGSVLEDGTPTVLAELEGREVAHLLEDIEGYLCELTGAQIRDGLHILGTLPSGTQLVDLVYHLLRLPNLAAPSLPAAVATALGEDWRALQEQPGRRRLGDTRFLTNADLIEHVENLCRQLLSRLNDADWSVDAVAAIISHHLPAAHHTEPVATALQFACDWIVPKLRQSATAEIAHLLAALAGQFVPPGPSGAPTRGMAHVLPTGRNFYSLDPRSIPSIAAWETGQGLARDLIQRYRREYGTFPESVGISIWGTSLIRTAGDDVAQVMALLGVRPRWQRENRRVIGFEIIPLAELGRPRIDVVCRISGFFRDAFPHLIELIDQAVQAVIALDEPLTHNFPRKHALTTAQSLVASGLDDETAQREAAYRIFGSPPGSYGAGMLPLIDGQNWTGDADLARVYLKWGGYAYTATEQGVPAEQAFAAALSTVQVATKNQDNREHDIFDSDDYFQFHGGMIAAIRALSGRNPARYFGDSSDPARPRTRDLREEARRVFRARVVNPKWIASMRRHGYKGGLELAATVDYLFGYDATAQVLADWMYEQVTERYLRDPEVQQWLQEVNPWALQAIAERLNEAIGRGMWREPSAEAQAAIDAVLAWGEEQREGLYSQ